MKFLKYILFFIIIFFSIGQILDLEAQRVINQFYGRNENGIINGCEDIQYVNNNKKAILFIHGYLSDPSWSEEVICKLKKSVDSDFYSVLLPFHGRNLKKAAKLNNQTIENFIYGKINLLTQNYKELYILARSYGGASTLKVIPKIKDKKNITLILYSPAIFLKKNNLIGRIKLFILGLWRKYYNYQIMNLEARSLSEALDDKLRYFIISAAKQVFKQDSTSRDKICEIDIPTYIFIAKDDEYIDTLKLIDSCKKNKNISFNIFSSGGHNIHNAKKVQNIFMSNIIDIIQKGKLKIY